jgi:preprotein translocase subunit SecD
MAEYVTRIRTESGDKQIDYNALANLPTTDKTLSQSEQAADAKATGDKINTLNSEITKKINNVSSGASNEINALDSKLSKAISDVRTESKAYSDSVKEEISKAVNDVSNAKFDKSGGTITGAINMSSKKITNLATPTANTDAANKKYVDDKHFIKTATLSTTWSGSSAPYSQVVSVSGILKSDNPHVSPVYSDTLDTAIKQKDSWLLVSRAVTDADKITFYCFDGKPDTTIPIQIEVNR